MAERVIRQIIDDIDKSEIAEGEGERIKFTFRGVAYQLDLSNANVAKLEKALAPYIDAAASASSGIEGSTSAADERPSPRRRRAAKKTAKRNRRPIARSGKEQLAAIRASASETGYSVSARGRSRRCCRGVSDGTSAISRRSYGQRGRGSGHMRATVRSRRRARTRGTVRRRDERIGGDGFLTNRRTP